MDDERHIDFIVVVLGPVVGTFRQRKARPCRRGPNRFVVAGWRTPKSLPLVSIVGVSRGPNRNRRGLPHDGVGDRMSPKVRCEVRV